MRELSSSSVLGGLFSSLAHLCVCVCLCAASDAGAGQSACCAEHNDLAKHARRAL